jgi:lysozyme family protein
MAIQQLPSVQVLRQGARSEAARALQAATNRRLRSRGLDALAVAEDGVVGTRTLEAVRKIAWALGARSETYDAITRDGEISTGVQRMIRNPGRRSDEQCRRGKARMSRLREQRKQQAAHPTSARSKAVNAFLAKVGTKERPAGSNGGGIITTMETYWGFGRVAWCGIACGYHAAKFGGVKGLRSDVASVRAIEGHARAQHSPYGRWQRSPEGALPGSLVVIGGSGVHVGMLVQPLSGGRAKTVEGNTSSGHAGSQSDGGCIAARVRSAAEITGVATMNYPD